MRKLTYQELFDSMTMFFVYDDICNLMTNRIDCKCQELKSRITKNLNSRRGLEEYIRKYDDSLDNLLLLLDISEEYFKRVISMLRKEEGMVFNTEWSLKKTRDYIVDNEKFMNKVCLLFLLGSDDLELCKKIPSYQLQSFKITGDVIERLENNDFLYRIAKKDFDSEFNTQVSQANAKRVENVIQESIHHHGYKLDTQYKVKVSNQKQISMNFAIKKNNSDFPQCLIKTSFSITTGQGQSSLRSDVGLLATYLRDNELRDKTKLVTIVDGAGWLGRQSDLQLIHDYSDYCLNFNNLGDLRTIINTL